MEAPSVWRVVADEIDALKCIGDEATLQEYVAASAPPASEALQDWSGIYLQMDMAHCIGTVPYRWDRGYQSAAIVALKFRDLPVVIVDAPWMVDGNVGSKAKALAVNQALGMDADKPLLEALAERGEALTVRETQAQWELVLGPALLRRLDELMASEHVSMDFQPNSFGATGKFRAAGETAWKRYDDRMASAAASAPSWLTAAMQSGAQTQAETIDDAADQGAARAQGV